MALDMSEPAAVAPLEDAAHFDDDFDPMAMNNPTIHQVEVPSAVPPAHDAVDDPRQRKTAVVFCPMTISSARRSSSRSFNIPTGK
jgi:hypothetical protein